MLTIIIICLGLFSVFVVALCLSCCVVSGRIEQSEPHWMEYGEGRE